ncbi:MAG: tetratricopeptide repeat protein [bacterium]
MLQRKCLICRNLALVFVYTIFGIASARAQGHYETELAKAEQAYNEGFFDQVIALTDSCLAKGDLTMAEQAWAYKLLGQAYVSKNEPQQARLYVQKLLEAAPDYAPDQDQDLQTWIALVEEAKQERERQIQQQQLTAPPDDEPVVHADSTKKGRDKKWLWIGGGGTVVTAGIVYLLVSQKEQKKSSGFVDPVGRP